MPVYKKQNKKCTRLKGSGVDTGKFCTLKRLVEIIGCVDESICRRSVRHAFTRRTSKESIHFCYGQKIYIVQSDC